MSFDKDAVKIDIGNKKIFKRVREATRRIHSYKEIEKHIDLYSRVVSNSFDTIKEEQLENFCRKSFEWFLLGYSEHNTILDGEKMAHSLELYDMLPIEDAQNEINAFLLIKTSHEDFLAIRNLFLDRFKHNMLEVSTMATLFSLYFVGYSCNKKHFDEKK